MNQKEDSKQQVEEANKIFLKLPRALRQQWKLFSTVSPEKLMERITENDAYLLSEKRDLFISYLAQRIGYRWYSRRSTLTTTPLWELLSRRVFVSLNKNDKKILRYIANSTPEHAYSLHPKAALANIALWRFGGRSSRNLAQTNIETRGLPSKPEFLYQLIDYLLSTKKGDTHLLMLGRILLKNNFSVLVALLGGLKLTRVFSPWRLGSPGKSLREGCQIASEEFPFKSAKWIQLIADAILKGKLRSSWMEPVMGAAIRISIHNLERSKTLRKYHQQNPYEASRNRIEDLYAFELQRIHKPVLNDPFSTKTICIEKLVNAFDEGVETNPVRAIAILERVIEEVHSNSIQRVLSEVQALDLLTEKLFRAYLVTFTLDRYAVKFVKATQHDSRVQDIDPARIENFLTICDYEYSFKNTLVDIAGMQIEHLDKDTAAKIRYFQTSRQDPNSITKMLAKLTGQSDWVFRRLLEAEPIADGVEFVFEQFLDRVSTFDFSKEVILDLQNYTQIEKWEDIPNLPIPPIEFALKKSVLPRVFLAGGAGLISGGAGPLSFGLSTVLDTTLLMYMAAEVCARYCWYYGFDPRENTDIIAMILGVALQGARIRSVKSDVIRDDLRRVLMYRSIALGAISNGIALQMMAPVLSSFFQSNHTKPQKINYRLPGICAGLAMATNVSFIYDISESARWVLSDRFFARKYEHWNSRF